MRVHNSSDPGVWSSSASQSAISPTEEPHHSETRNPPLQTPVYRVSAVRLLRDSCQKAPLGTAREGKEIVLMGKVTFRRIAIFGAPIGLGVLAAIHPMTPEDNVTVWNLIPCSADSVGSSTRYRRAAPVARNRGFGGSGGTDGRGSVVGVLRGL